MKTNLKAPSSKPPVAPRAAAAAGAAATRPQPTAKPAPAVPAPEFKLVRTRRAFEEVAAQVRALLFDGTLKAGDRMPPERELCQMLGVGRPALREALRSLEASGLLELRKGKTGGAFVTSGDTRVVSGGMSDMLRLGKVSLEEMFEAREWLLSALVRPACRRITPPEIERLRENIDRAEQLHAAGRLEDRIDANFEFHWLVAEASRNQVATAVIRGLMDALRSVIREIGTELPPRYFEHRRALVKAFEKRDEDAAARLTATIVRSSEEIYKRLNQEHVQKEGAVAATAEAPAARQAAAKGPAARRVPVKRAAAKRAAPRSGSARGR